MRKNGHIQPTLNRNSSEGTFRKVQSVNDGSQSTKRSGDLGVKSLKKVKSRPLINNQIYL